jgi:hypothetical protein
MAKRRAERKTSRGKERGSPNWVLVCLRDIFGKQEMTEEEAGGTFFLLFWLQVVANGQSTCMCVAGIPPL